MQPILLKKDAAGNEVEWIHLPKADDEKIMFQEYMRKGLILSEGDFEREKKKYTVGGQFMFAAYRAENPERQSLEYPPTLISPEEKIRYLSERHPEFKKYFDLALIFDIEDPTDLKHTKRQETLLSLIESSIFDNLLGEMIYSRGHFVEHLGKGELGSIQVFDFKFLKEVNDSMTYADADNSIKMLWEKIKSAVPTEERNKLIVSRFAGALYLGVKKGTSLSEECQIRLDKIKSLPFGREGQYSVPIGRARIDLQSEDNYNLLPYQIVNKLELASDREHSLQLAKDIQKEQRENNQFIAQMMAVDIEGLKTRDYQPLSKAELYALNLRGKRKDARIKRLVDCGDKSHDFEGDAIYSLLRTSLLQALVN